MKNKKTLTEEEIASKKDKFLQEIKKSEHENNNKKRLSYASNFLNEIRDLLQVALDSKLSFDQIKKNIETIYNFKVSSQTIRAFCKSELGYEKTKIKNKKIETSISIDVKKQKVLQQNIKTDKDLM